MAKYFLLTVVHLSLSLALLVHAQNPSDYLSLDCGLEDNGSYRDSNSNLTYQSDKGYIDSASGVSYSISSEHKNESLEKQFWNVRSFPEGNRNCYSFPAYFSPTDGGVQYLVRARFMYGNYDGNNSLPRFDIYFGTKWWDIVEFDSASSIITKEVVYTTQSDHIYVCLCNINRGTPFISVLELRPYRYVHQETYLELFARFNMGSPDGKIVRYPDDQYDQIWTPYNSVNWKSISAPLTEIEKLDKDASNPPTRVMSTAATPANGGDSISFKLSYNASSYTINLYFAEVQKLNKTQTRELKVTFNGDESDEFKPQYLTISSLLATNESNTEKTLEFQITRTSRSTLPPIINAIEIYKMKDLQQHETAKADHDVIKNIKSTYRINRNWHGDPCLPEDYRWEGLHCRNAAGTSTPKITNLNLSSSGLNGSIVDDISFLKSLEILDLSHNNLTGEVPDSLSQLNHLQVLNLEGNDLTGTIPQQLLEKSEKRLLKLSCHGNQNLCCSALCNKRRRVSKTKLLISLVASLGGAFLVIVVAVIFWIVRRKLQAAKTSKTPGSDFPLGSGINSDKQQFSYEEVKRITNNFERQLGKGGFGTVYHGHIGTTQVAVKMLSPSAHGHGYLQFQAEAELLTRVHHKCLTSLIGYCEDGTNVALIYEYMENGDLGHYLSEESRKFLGWKQRLQIAVDAAEGLEYLHNGCKPPIVHRDIKPQNILLDENMRGKLADFGLSRIFTDETDSHISTTIAGTLGYLDPQYFMSNRLNEKSDVFSFGVVLLEIITGQPAITRTEENTHIIKRLDSMGGEREIEDVVDSRLLRDEFSPECARRFLEIAMACVASASMNRPSMCEVVMELKQCLEMEMDHIHTCDDPHANSMMEIHVSFDMISGESSLER